MSGRRSAKGNGADWRRRLSVGLRSANETAVREALFAGARLGEQEAIHELWRRYRLRLEVPSGPVSRRA